MKKRYMFTLNQENVETLQGLVKEYGLPPGTLSNIVDDSIRQVAKVFLAARSNGTFTIKDIFAMAGEQMELIQNEEREIYEQAIGKTDKGSKKGNKHRNSA